MKNKNGYAVYAVQLGEEERNSEPLHLDVLYVFTDILKPLPKTLTQDDPHKVLFESTSLVPSPYETTEQVRVDECHYYFIWNQRGSIPCAAPLH